MMTLGRLEGTHNHKLSQVHISRTIMKQMITTVAVGNDNFTHFCDKASYIILKLTRFSTDKEHHSSTAYWNARIPTSCQHCVGCDLYVAI